MRRVRNLRPSHDFYWPGFADMMLASLLIVLMILAWTMGEKISGQVNIEKVKSSQSEIINALAASFGTHAKILDVAPQLGCSEYEIGVSTTDSSKVVKISTTLDRQRLTFSDQLLFPPNRADLSQPGRDLMRRVGRVLRLHLNQFQEIQVLGHADKRPPDPIKFGDNMSLAALRALEVVAFLRDSLEINPREHVMSATSYGEYLPLGREPSDLTYGEFQWVNHDRDGRDSLIMARDRRVEIQLIYRQK